MKIKDFLRFKSEKPQPVDKTFLSNQKMQSYNNLITLTNTLKSWSGICINKISNTVASVPFYAVRKNAKGEFERLPNEHWLNQLLTNPNKPQKLTLSELNRLITQWILCNGNAYIHTPKYDGKYPIQMWLLPSNNVTILPGSNNLIDSFEVQAPGGMTKFSPLEVCHIKTLSPSLDWNKNYIVGTPISLNNAIDSIQADYETKQFIKNHFAQEALSPLVLYGDYNEQSEIDLLKANFKRGGVKNSIAGVLPTANKLEAIEQSQLAKQTIASQFAGDLNQKQIVASFNIPYGIIDTTSQQNKATAEVNIKDFRENCIEPLLIGLENSLSIHFQQYEDNIYVTHDSFLYVDKEYEMQKLGYVVGANSITINELRKEYNLEPIPEGDVLINQNLYNNFSQGM